MELVCFFKIYCKQQQQEQTITSMHSVREYNDLNETLWLIMDSSLRLAGHLWLIFGSLSNDAGNVTENGKKATGLDWQSNNFALASHFFCTFFFALIARLRRENAYFHVLWKVWTQEKTFFLLSWTSIQSFRIQLQKKFANIWRIERDGIRCSATSLSWWSFRCRYSLLLKLDP